MRKEPFGVGSVVHVVKRGTRGLPIVRDREDRERFLLMLLHFNDTFTPLNWFRDLTIHSVEDRFLRPDIWPQKEKLVHILAFSLLDNHFHLLLEEITEGGIARFMHRLGIGMAKSFNEKYRESGALFQGSYRAKTIDDDVYLRYVSVYIQVKNTLEMSPYNNVKNDTDFLKGYQW